MELKQQHETAAELQTFMSDMKIDQENMNKKVRADILFKYLVLHINKNIKNKILYRL